MRRLAMLIMLAAAIAAAGCAKKQTEQTSTVTDTTGTSTTTEGTATTTPGNSSTTERTTTERSASSESAGAPATAPDTSSASGGVSGTWQRIDAEDSQVSQGMSHGALGDVHRHAYAIRDLVATLPGAAIGLTTTERGRVSHDVALVAREAHDLAMAADAGDTNATQTALKALQVTLNDLRGLTAAAK